MAHRASERELIKEIRRWVGKDPSPVLHGIGDDTAVLKSPRGKLLATVDMMVEGVHFDLAYTIPQELGHKALAVNLSDIAAMGGVPQYALVSLAVPSRISTAFLRDLYKGIRTLAHRHGLAVVGGNVSRSSTRLAIDITVLGEAKRRAVLRSGCRVGDVVGVTGNLGSSAAGLKALKAMGRNAVTKFPRLTKAHLTPQPHLIQAQTLVRTKAVTAMIDVSDGLSTELSHLATASHVGFEIEEEKLPRVKSLEEAGKKFHVNPLRWILEGGEDYRILFTARSKHWPQVQRAFKKLGKPVYAIGKVTPFSAKTVLLRANGKSVPLESKGWDHLKITHD